MKLRRKPRHKQHVVLVCGCLVGLYDKNGNSRIITLCDDHFSQRENAKIMEEHFRRLEEEGQH